MSTAEYAAKEPIAVSLFPSDQAVLGDEAVARILSSKLELPTKAKVGLMKFPDSNGVAARYYGSYYWQNEEYLKLQQAQVDTLSGALLVSDHIMEVIPLPSLMIPRQMSIPVLREAAVRAGGHATLFAPAEGQRAAVPRFTPVTAPLDRIHRDLKREFDPAGIFNRGRFVPEL